MTPPILVEATRRDEATLYELVESRHRGHVVVVDGAGDVVLEVGDAGRRTFVRSTAKPFQATAALEAAAAAGAPPPSDAEIAVAWSSHRGEPRHLEAVQSLAARAGIEPDALTCPPARSLDDPGAGVCRLHHNCSGKHAMFAFAGAHLGIGRDRLLRSDGPLQTRVLALLEQVLGPPTAVGIDGCGAPAVAVPLVALARGWLALGSDDRFSGVCRAGLAYPELVGGSGRLESALLAEGVLAKPGAEGLFALAARDDPAARWAAAVKIEDGATRAAPVAAAAIAAAFGATTADWEPPPVLGGGLPRGRLRPASSFLAAMARS